MSEENLPPPVPEAPQESSLFPVAKEAADRGLAEIAKDPDRAMIEEGAALQTGNPELNLGLMTLIKTFPVNEGVFSEGALWTHRILRSQAEANGQSLPRVTREGWVSHVQSRMEQLRTIGGQDPKAGLWAGTLKEVEDITQQDPAFGEAVGQLVKYRAGRPDFYHGVVNTYLPLKAASEAGKMNKQLGMQQ